jgi:hypothetical protein
MEEEKQESPETGGLFNRYHFVIELILATVLIISFFLNANSPGWATTLQTIVILGLAIFYFYMAFVPLKSENMVAMVASKLTFIALSVSLIGIQLRIWGLYASLDLMFIGSMALLVCILLLLATSFKNWQKENVLLIVRALVVLIISTVMMQII